LGGTGVGLALGLRFEPAFGNSIYIGVIGSTGSAYGAGAVGVDSTDVILLGEGAFLGFCRPAAGAGSGDALPLLGGESVNVLFGVGLTAIPAFGSGAFAGGFVKGLGDAAAPALELGEITGG